MFSGSVSASGHDHTTLKEHKVMVQRRNDVACVWLSDGRCFVVSAYGEADAHQARLRREDEAVLAAPGGHAAAVIR